MKILTKDDILFPKRLLDIKSCPKKIYVDGNVNILNKPAIGIVGSRNCSEYGIKCCQNFTKELLEYELVIISGMAIGIDKIAHETAIKYGGKTIAVLPSGFQNIYPKENMDLYKKILENDGAVITEYTPEEKAEKAKFLARNRIVSGLSLGVLVVEASFISGTSVTVKFAKEQGREVYCIPGSLENKKSMGTNIMIQKGAKLVTRVKDIVSNYDFLEKKVIMHEKEYEEVDEKYKGLYDIICKKPMTVNEISKITKKNINEIMSQITMLEIEEKIERNNKGEICWIKK